MNDVVRYRKTCQGMRFTFKAETASSLLKDLSFCDSIRFKVQNQMGNMSWMNFASSLSITYLQFVIFLRLANFFSK